MSKIRLGQNESLGCMEDVRAHRSSYERKRVTNADCVRWSNVQGRCSILNYRNCPSPCKSFTDDPEVLLKEVEDMMIVNKDNKQSMVALRRERKYLCQKYGLRPDSIEDVYNEDKHRGSGGGHSEGDTSNSAASMKQKMKDNRPVECKKTMAEREAIKEATKEWEEENGKLPKLARSSMGRSKVDTYTGEDL